MKKIILSVLAIILSTTLFAAQRTVEQAAAIAAEFTNAQPALARMHKAPRTTATMRLAYTGLKPASSEAAYYVFNQENNAGAVFVSADDRTTDVLGYTVSGQFNPTTVNPNLKWWLERYADHINQVTDEMALHVKATRKAVQVTKIEPLLVNDKGVEITWYQEAPYYNLCPEDCGGHSLTGCVATAASQVMYKWRYPAKGTGTNSYTWYKCTAGFNSQGYCKSDGTPTTLFVDYGATSYDWDNMLPAYEGKSSTSAQKNAVATLMYHAGVASKMDYSSEGSGAWTDDMAAGLRDHFGYRFTKFISMYSKSKYESNKVKNASVANVPYEFSVTLSQITAYFNADLEAGRPIIMGGESNGSGHEFVCCGRDTNGKYYINWGWEGEENGYFALDVMGPVDQDDDYFKDNLDALIGLEPDKDPVAVTGVTVSPTSKTIDQKEKLQLTATVTPSDATNKQVTWSSDKPAIATVDDNGKVTGVAQGTAVITVTTKDGGKTAQATITVTDQVVAVTDCDPYSYTFTEKMAASKQLGEYWWTLYLKDDTYQGFDSQYGRGAQFGSKNSPAQEVTLTTEAVKDCLLSDIVINASLQSGGDAKVAVYIGDTQVGTSQSLSESATDYTFNNTAELQGTLKISLTNSTKAMFLKYIKTNVGGIGSGCEQFSATKNYTIKRIENGQLVIIVDGIRYNALGQKLQ